MDDSLRQIEHLKSKDTCNINWELLNAYTTALIKYPQSSLDHKLEQELWNSSVKDKLMALKQNNPAFFIQSLSALNGFYVRLLEELCLAFRLNLPENSVLPHLQYPHGYWNDSSNDYELFLCQYCLIHLGDLARYRNDLVSARQYYQLAAEIEPRNGHPYNQIAILEILEKNKLGVVFFYIRSVSVPNPFNPGLHNLHNLFQKVCNQGLGRVISLSLNPSTSSMVDSWVSTLILFHGMLHTRQREDKLSYIRGRFMDRFSAMLEETCPSLSKLIHVVVLSLYMTDLIFKDFSLKSTDSSLFFEAIGFTVELLDVLVKAALPETEDLINSGVLPGLKLLLDWLCSHRALFVHPIFPKKFWSTFCPLLNRLCNQPRSEEYMNSALPEDKQVRLFAPLARAHEMLDFENCVPPNMRTAIRSLRVVDHAIWIADQFPERRFISYQYTCNFSIKFFTPAPSGGMSPKFSPMTYPGAMPYKRESNSSSPTTWRFSYNPSHGND